MTTPTQAEIDAAAAEAQKKALADAQTKKVNDAATAKKDAATAKKDAATAAEKAARATDDRISAEINEDAAEAADTAQSTPQTKAALAEATQATANAKAAETNAKNDAASAAAASSAADKKAADAEKAANPPATNTLPGLKFMTVGTSEKVTVGTDSSLSIGASTKLALSNTVSLTAGMSNTVAFGTTLGVNLGPKITWNMNSKFHSYTLDEGKSYSFAQSKDEKAAEKYTISAGATIAGQLIADSLEAAKKTIKTSLKVLSAVNVAGGVAAGVALCGANKGDGNQNVVDQTKISLPMSISAGVTALGLSVGSTVSSIVTLAVVYKALNAWKELYDKTMILPSTIALDSNGIKQSVIFATTGSMLNLLASGVEIKSGPPAVAAPDKPRVLVPPKGVSSVTLSPDGHAAMNGLLSTTINSPADVKVGQVGDAGLTSGLSAMPAEVKLQNTDASTVKLTSASAKISSKEISILGGANGFSAKDGAQGHATMVGGSTSKVVAMNGSLEVSAGKSGTVDVIGARINITGQVIKLG